MLLSSYYVVKLHNIHLEVHVNNDLLALYIHMLLQRCSYAETFL